jgi:hypothetical protein
MKANTLFQAMVSGRNIILPMTDGYGSFNGRVMGMVAEDGSGKSWIIYFQTHSPYPNGGTQTHMIHVRTDGPSYRARLLGKAKQVP